MNKVLLILCLLGVFRCQEQEMSEELIDQQRKEFGMIDQNDDGIISKNEIENYFIQHNFPERDQVQIRKEFFEADLNGNNEVDFDEYMEFMAKYGNHGDGPNDGPGDNVYQSPDYEREFQEELDRNDNSQAYPYQDENNNDNPQYYGMEDNQEELERNEYNNIDPKAAEDV